MANEYISFIPTRGYGRQYPEVALKNERMILVLKGTPGDSEHRGGEDTRETASFLHFMGFIIICLTS